MSLISKIILLELILPFSTLAKAETQCFVHLSFNSTFQLIYDISNDHQKLLIYFNDTATVAFFRIELFPSETNNLALFSSRSLLVSRSVALSLE